MSGWGAAPTVIPAPLPSFPRKRESRTALPYNVASSSSNRKIPAYAGMTVAGRKPAATPLQRRLANPLQFRQGGRVFAVGQHYYGPVGPGGGVFL